MQWLAINWYIIAAVVAALLLGWGVGVWYGTSKGYAAAMEEIKRFKAQAKWSEYLNQFNKNIFELNKEMKNEKGED